MCKFSKTGSYAVIAVAVAFEEDDTLITDTPWSPLRRGCRSIVVEEGR